jgi:PAS domain S-box-containing protein
MYKNPSPQKSDKPREEFFPGHEEKFKQLIKNSFDMLVLLDAHGMQQYVSESCEHILGYTPQELMNVPVIDRFIHPEDQAITRQGLRDIIENDKNGGTQYRHRHKNGGWVYLEAFGTNQLDNPAVGSVVLNVRDITERKKAEQALVESETRLSELNATKDRFFSIISHDLRSPFNSIVGFSDLLTTQVKNKDYQGIERYARIIKESSKKAMELLTNLLEWSRTQTSSIEFAPEYFELVTTIQEVLELLEESAHQKSITITLDLPHNLPVMADKAMIHTILRNLLSNAIKFTHPEGRIVIEAKQQPHQVAVSVVDTGVGMQPGEIGRLFRMDQQFTRPGTRKETGTGLGLLLCKEFVELHGGTINAESQPNQGSKFTFTIPLAIYD